MARERSPNRDKAFNIFKEHDGNIANRLIAEMLNVPEKTISGWKVKDQWNGVLQKKIQSTPKNKGGQPGNRNAVGNSGGAAPPGNKNAEKHGLFSKYLPAETLELVEAAESMNPLDVLWDQITIQYAAIIRSQQIMHVKNQEDKTREQISESENSASYKVDQAWDKQANFLQAQSRAMTSLNGMIKNYDDLLHKNWDLATEEQRARIAKLRAELGKIEKTEDKSGSVEYKGIPANMIAPVFAPVLFHIENQAYLEYVFPGGRGSTKSSFIGLNVIDLLMKNDQIHACVMRQVADTLRGSVYNQILWAIDALNLNDEFHATVSPLEITRKSTGQKIYFRGADDPGKVKSIKVPFGYIAVLWFEELDQFAGSESVRKIEQSAIRGGDTAYIFKSFNPPKSASNWANQYIKIPKQTRLVAESTYLDVPPKWLGKPFIDEAEFLKAVNPVAYENEYMGIANGAGGNVFENITIRRITLEEISQFDRRYKGVDWGWYPDPYHYADMHYDAARMTLYIFNEYRCNKKSNKETADELKRRGVTGNDLLTCDSAENKSIADYKAYGLLARGADKFPGSVDYSMKWLQSLCEIVIDNERCPETTKEFMEYEYDRDKEGNIISGYPDKNNHAIDAVRYGMFPVWKRRGQ